MALPWSLWYFNSIPDSLFDVSGKIVLTMPLYTTVLLLRGSRLCSVE